MKEKRCSLRINYRAAINITFSTGETIKASTRDISDGGLLIECPTHPKLTPGDLAEVIVLGINEAVPRTVEIIRIDIKGYLAVRFIPS